ncbi:MAG: hypothetical protein KJ749_08630, partial [Planctomycetes bacterium]|nr:hypothetical protein [Planctomycetota bacterium]
FLEVGNVGRLMLTGATPFFMTVAARDELMLGTTLPGAAEDWLRGAYPAGSFVDGDDFGRMIDRCSARIAELYYLELRSLIPVLTGMAGEPLPGLWNALELDNLEFVGAIGDQPTLVREGQVAEQDASPGTLRVLLGMREIRPGLSHLLASTPADVGLAKVFPAETTLLLHGSMDRGSAIIEDCFALARIIDEEIAEEYAQEREEFAQDVGIDPEDFLANFVEEWALGAKVRGGSPLIQDILFAVKLKSPTDFAADLQRLCAAYNLETSRHVYREVAIEQAARHAGPFYYAVVDNVLLVSPDMPTIKRAVDASLDDTGLSQVADFEGIRRKVCPQTSKFVYLDVARVFANIIETGEPVDLPILAELIAPGSALGFAVVPHERMVAVEIAASKGNTPGLVDVLTLTVAPSLRRARYLSNRMISMSNMKSILIASHIYAGNHQGTWPRSLAELVADGLLGDLSEAVQTLSNPYEREGIAGTKPFYLYRQIPDAGQVKSPSEVVVVSEPTIRQGGALFGFVDGHVEWIASPRAEELLAIMRGN